MKALLRILALWRPRWGWLAAGLVVSFVSLACAVALLGVSGRVVAGAVLGLPLVAGLSLRVLGPARVALRYAERMVTHDATFRALADLRVWFFRGLARGRAGGLGFARSGDLLARLVGDVEALDGLYVRILVPLACAALLLPALLVLAWPHGWVLAAILAVLFVASAFALPVLAAGAAWSGGQDLARARSDLRVAALDAFAGLREVRAFGAEGRVLASVQSREAAMLGAGRALAREGARFGAAAQLLGQVALLAVLALAGRQHPVAAAALAFAVVAIFEAAAVLPRSGTLAGHAAASARRVIEAAEAPAAVADPARPAPAPRTGGLRFEGVHFGYGAGRPVLDGLTLDIPAGGRVAVLGASGAGKSTLAALALKLEAPLEGRVLMGGVDIATLAAADVRALVSWLGQSTHLFADTVRANLLLARPDADEAALWASLDAARVGDFVRGLPDGLDTWLGEAGAGVSGGQGRRLALARALLSEAPLLLLDEPCAGLDAETEREFFLALNEAAFGRTVMLIVHRLTGVERLDRIFRMSAGRAVAAAG